MVEPQQLPKLCYKSIVGELLHISEEMESQLSAKNHQHHQDRDRTEAGNWRKWHL